MIRFTYILFLSIISVQVLDADTSGYEIWDRSGATWYEKWDKFLSRSDEFSDTQKINYYGKALGVGNNPIMSDTQKEIYTRTQKLLTSLPGHADFYDQRIREHLQRAKKFEGTDRQYGFATTLMDKAEPDFRTLSHLPSPETVKVLGELLSEDWVVLRNGQPFNRPLAGFAMSSLHRMPFTSKPVQGDYVSDEKDLETYRLWYAQIKAGNRTFRFEGDPNEYTLAGPVRSSPELATTAPKARDTVNSLPPGETGPNPSTPWLAVTLGCALIGGALWYWLTTRRRA
jgi:hypothetical protein